MTLVRIVKDWESPDLYRQTPGHTGRWGSIDFTLAPVAKCDYLVILNCPPKDSTVTVKCPSGNIWAIMQEPPNEVWKPMHAGVNEYSQIFTQDIDLRGRRYIHSQPVLPWHVDKDFDFLVKFNVPTKDRALSWITSNYTYWEGHRSRMAFLNQIQEHLNFDLYGRGFKWIDDKWAGLAPYKYSLAIENFQNAYYWSEKIADCFLAWTMPIYFGCTRIEEYFPKEAMIIIDIADPSSAIEQIQSAISSNLWEKRIDAIAHARDLVLNKHQIFPFIAEAIMKQSPPLLKRVKISSTTTIKGYNRIPPINETSLLCRIKSMCTKLI
ncbi:glycosyltransferase family 10 [Geotalea sp. SG265]|uniref:glycosyltransferase family 10 domain-containing protein n=1 Tax=Geotalea sp. SG265 TaxID=2922867 RepID=UPI001FAFC4FE|nr:glycosyltransferase family 10 [Geotalea sp. SG265]